MQKHSKDGTPAVVTRKPDTTPHGDRRTRRERDRSSQRRNAIKEQRDD